MLSPPEMAITPNTDDPEKWDIRSLSARSGIIGYRMLKGEPEFPAEYKGLTLDEAVHAQKKWQSFVNEQHTRLNKNKKRRRR